MFQSMDEFITMDLGEEAGDMSHLIADVFASGVRGREEADGSLT